MATPPGWARWPEIDALFARALDEPPDRRLRFLAEACGDDHDLLRTLTDLVTASERAERELAGPGDAILRVALGHPTDTPPPAAASGARVGRYRLVRERGRGGMATVYEAERADGAYQQRVALKLLRRGADREDLSRRFRVETRALASLAHSNIARLLDAGTTDDDHPFLVMELVDGEPITAWADARRVPIEGRLDLFLQVAHAVSYAHRHLVVHRDLKPSNVHVGADGQVRLLDFGIAKLLEAEDPTAAETRPTTRWMTPGYASPEQVLGRPVTTATDVHGLGVLLYELLAGRRPFGDGGAIGFDLDRAVCEVVPARPSAIVGAAPDVAAARATAPDRLRRHLAGDLDAIVGKALRKEPAERYASVAAMARDVERYRDGLPVEARAGLRTYRLRKFVRRHWLAVGSAATLAAVLLGSSLALWRLQVATARARDDAAWAAARATEEAENARLVTGFLADVFRGRDPAHAPPDTVTARDLLAWGRERVESEFDARPALQAGLFAVLGDAYANLGLLDRSAELHGRAVALRRGEHGPRSVEVATALMDLSQVLRESRRATDAVPAAREALAILHDRLAPDDPALVDGLVELALGWSLYGQPDSAEPLLRRAVTLLDQRGERATRRYVTALLALAPVRRAQGALDDAERLYDEAIPRFRALGRPDAELAGHLNNLGFLRRTRGDFAGAEPLYREAFDIFGGIHGRGHPTSLLMANNLAIVLHRQGKLDDAELVLRARVDAARVQWPEGHWRVGSAHATLARMLLSVRRIDDALRALGEARRSYTDMLGADHLWTQFLEATAAAGHVARGRPDLGQPYLDRFFQLRSDDPPGTLAARQDLANLLVPFVGLLDDLGLAREAARFRTLIPTTGADPGD